MKFLEGRLRVVDSFLKWWVWLNIWSKVLRSESECVCDSLAVSACWCKAPIGRQPLTSAETCSINYHCKRLTLHCTHLPGVMLRSLCTAWGLIFVGAVIIGINTCICPPVVWLAALQPQSSNTGDTREQYKILLSYISTKIDLLWLYKFTHRLNLGIVSRFIIKKNIKLYLFKK